MIDSTQRFSSRVENYIRYRPDYPHAVIECLRANCDLTAHAEIADVGSGTGILAEMLLRNGNRVYGVEPNREMRAAGERLLGNFPRFHSIAASAEATTLRDGSVDFVTAGQAFHWFDRDRAKAEFRRILRPQGWVVLVWNERRDDSTPFGRDYERLLQTYATDYQQIDHRRIDEKVLSQFFDTGFEFSRCQNSQQFDFEGLQGRLLSSSYAPEVDHPHYAAMIAQLQTIFDSHQNGGKVAFDYDTNIYYGQLG